MKRVQRMAKNCVLFAAVLWFSLALGSVVWASDASSVAKDSGHAVAAGHASDAGHAVQNSLSPAKLKDLGLRVMNFAALMIILVKFGAKPIGSALSGRRKQVKDDLESLEAKKAAAERSYKEFSAKLASVEKDVDQIVEKAIAQAEIEKAKIIERAEKMAEDIKRQAQMAVANEVTAARRMLKNEIADQAAVMAEALIIKNLTGDDQVKIVEDYLDKVGAIQ
ncbi:MAG: ATP synthase F0 subunit B [Desulfobulbaceae bacterium]|nr:ATP synthase F0 subunit B [Desulfobulbaceae bacterium]